MTPLAELKAMSERWDKILRDGASAPEWKRKVTLKIVNQFGCEDLVGMELELAKFMGDLFEKFPKFLKQLEAAEELVKEVEGIGLTTTECHPHDEYHAMHPEACPAGVNILLMQERDRILYRYHEAIKE